MRSYIKQIDSLNTLNMNLRTETAAAKQEAKEANDKYNDIKVTTDEYAKQVEKGSVLRGRGVTMIGITSNGKETDRSGKISRLKSCLSLVENSIAKKGPRTVYIRIKGPDGILMTNNQQNVFIVAGEQMLYSASSEVEICIYFAEGGFTKGTYTVDAYTAEGKLGSAQTFLR